MSSEDEETPFDVRYQRLVDEAGLVPDDLVEPGDYHPEHKRYAVYLRVEDQPHLRGLLVSCLSDDPDPLMASSAFVRLLNQADASQRRVLADAAQGWRRAFVDAWNFQDEWARTLDTLDALRVDEPAPSALQALLNGSDRLQRLAAELSSITVLESLEQHGRTRRVRGVAREKLKRIRPTWSTPMP